MADSDDNRLDLPVSPCFDSLQRQRAAESDKRFELHIAVQLTLLQPDYSVAQSVYAHIFYVIFFINLKNRLSKLYLLISLQIDTIIIVVCAHNLTQIGFAKRCKVVVHSRIFNDILTAMSEDRREYSDMRAMIDKAILSHRCSKFIIGVYSTVVLLYRDDRFSKADRRRLSRIAYQNEVPVCILSNSLRFMKPVVFAQFVHLMAAASTIGMFRCVNCHLGKFMNFTNRFVVHLNRTYMYYHFIVVIENRSFLIQK